MLASVACGAPAQAVHRRRRLAVKSVSSSPPALHRAAGRQSACLLTEAPRRSRTGRRRVVSTRAGVLETGITLAEALAGLATLQLAKNVVGGLLGGGARDAAANTAVNALKGVNAAPSVVFGGQKGTVKLVISVLIDAVGASSYLFPGLGEASDAGWAPISATLVQALYGSWLLTVLDFLEEALPFSDALPTACIGWVLEYTPASKLVGWVPKSSK